ncbi:MAG TPA: universal stress protein [Pirellulales bacterium]|nr:universal stress protein [Pirellulales bacterium]
MSEVTKKILFATDYSEASQSALTYAASLARDTGAVLVVVHVSQLEQYPVGELFDEDPQPSDEELAELRAVKAPDPRIPCEHRLLYGDPAEEIVKLADQEGVEAIVIGTHERSRIARLLGGSVAEKLLRTAHCPVVTYRLAQQTARTGTGEEGGKAATCDDRRPIPTGAKQKAKAAADSDLQRTVKEWAANRSELYNIFNKHGIDVLWDGHRRLIDMCRDKHVNPRHVADELAAACEPAYREGGTNWHRASFTELCDHLQSTHHDYLRRELPRLGALVADIDEESRRQHPELDELRDVFDSFRQQLMEHVEVEEGALYSALRAIDARELSVEDEAVDPRGLAHRMRDDHDQIGAALLRIRRLTNGYTPPRGASPAHRALVAGLWELEATLQLAIREEDDILLPMVLAH